MRLSSYTSWNYSNLDATGMLIERKTRDVGGDTIPGAGAATTGEVTNGNLSLQDMNFCLDASYTRGDTGYKSGLLHISLK